MFIPILTLHKIHDGRFNFAIETILKHQICWSTQFDVLSRTLCGRCAWMTISAPYSTKEQLLDMGFVSEKNPCTSMYLFLFSVETDRHRNR